MKEYLLANPDPENVTELRFSLNDKASLAKLEWENSHEFWYNNEMFDLLGKKKENNQLIILCVNDKKESNLVKLQERISKENQGDASSKSRSAVLLKLIQTTFIQINLAEMFDFSSEHKFSCQKDFNIASVYRDVLTPPPQLF